MRKISALLPSIYIIKPRRFLILPSYGHPISPIFQDESVGTLLKMQVFSTLFGRRI